MFLKSARYYDAAYGFKDYTTEAQLIREVIQRYHPNAHTLLDVACGTGQHLYHLRQWYEVAGLDLQEELLAGARRRCPDVPFHHASMLDFELPTDFDVITCLFSSIGYARTTEHLGAALTSMRRHLREGGVILIEPWFSPDSFWTGAVTTNATSSAGVEAAWMYTSEAEDGLAILDVQYLFGIPGRVEHFAERHELGLFSPEEYRAAIEQVGLMAEHDPIGPLGRGLFAGVDRRGPHGKSGSGTSS